MCSIARTLSFTAILAIAATSAAHADCRNITNTKKRMNCVETRIDDLQTSLATLQTAITNLQTTIASLPKPLPLEGVVIETLAQDGTHMGQCLNWIDQLKPIEARPCGTVFGTFLIHKK